MGQILAVSPNSLLNFTTGGPVVRHRTNRCPPLAVSAEGKGVNVARILASFGHHVELCSFAGGPSGRWFAEILTGEGLPHHLVPTRARLRCGFLGDPGTEAPTELLEDGFAVGPAESGEFLAAIADRLPGADLVVVGGSVPDRNNCHDLLARIAAAAAAAAVPCWIDSYGPAMARALAGEHPVDVVKPNRREYAAIEGWSRAREIHCTDGPEPVTITAADGRRWRVRPPTVEQVNPVGAGDCYLAGLAHARLTGLEPAEQFRYAAAAGAAGAANLEAAGLAPASVEALRPQVGVEELESHGI